MKKITTQTLITMSALLVGACATPLQEEPQATTGTVANLATGVVVDPSRKQIDEHIVIKNGKGSEYAILCGGEGECSVRGYRDKQGLKQGLWTSSHTSGTFKKEIQFADDNIKGLVKEYEDGKLTEETIGDFEMTLKDGEVEKITGHFIGRRFYDNGKVRREIEIQDGEVVGEEKRYDREGNLKQ